MKKRNVSVLYTELLFLSKTRCITEPDLADGRPGGIYRTH